LKLLLYSWGSNSDSILKKNLIKLGHTVTELKQKCVDYTKDMELASAMMFAISTEKAEGVISFNYIPIVSMICEASGVPYYSWVYDSPHFTLFAGSINSKANHVGVFDRVCYERLKALGVQTVFHLPLAVDAEDFNETIKVGSVEKYAADVSFVGSLYSDNHDYYETLLNEEERIISDDLIDRQCFNYEEDCVKAAILEGKLDINSIRERMMNSGLWLGNEYFAEPCDILMPAVFDKHITVRERYTLIKRISDEIPNFRLYTNSCTDIKNHGTVDYRTEMPLVFNGSRINLNISLRSIRSGIPLRVLDIMACGGFVLTTPTPEIEEYFEDGKELVIFRGVEDCLRKIEFYLKNEDTRKHIAQNGLNAVKDRFSYEKILGKLVNF